MKILYLGDNAGASAEYLKSVLKDLDHAVTHVDSQAVFPDVSESFDVIIVSDYPATRIQAKDAEVIKTQVKAGARLIMLGGWDSFNGKGTNYYGHPLAQLLPVTLQAEDDRVNEPQGLILCKDTEFPDTFTLDWQKPPIICGYNAVQAKPESHTLVWIKPILSDGITIQLGEPLPLVCKGNYEKGVTIACATDVAPHWCGGLVDWGSERKQLESVEVGAHYIEFIRLLLET